MQIKLQLLEAMGNIEVGMKILNDDKKTDLNPVDRHYAQLKCDIKHLPEDHDEHKLVREYIESTHGKTHSFYTIQVEDIFSVSKSEEEERFDGSMGNRVLLFHGSRLSNWAGILSRGLRVAPPEAPSTGYMFGKGVYFADVASKSANYCWASSAR